MNKKISSFMLLFLASSFCFPAYSNDKEDERHPKKVKRVLVSVERNNEFGYYPSQPPAPNQDASPQFIEIGVNINIVQGILQERPISVAPWAMDDSVMRIAPQGREGEIQLGINKLGIPVWINSQTYNAMQNGQIPSIFNPNSEFGRAPARQEPLPQVVLRAPITTTPSIVWAIH